MEDQTSKNITTVKIGLDGENMCAGKQGLFVNIWNGCICPKHTWNSQIINKRIMDRATQSFLTIFQQLPLYRFDTNFVESYSGFGMNSIVFSWQYFGQLHCEKGRGNQK